MSVDIGSVWASEGGFTIRIIRNMGGSLYLYNSVNGIGCGGYVWAGCLIGRFTKVEAV